MTWLQLLADERVSRANSAPAEKAQLMSFGMVNFAIGTHMPVEEDSRDKSDRQPTLCRVVIDNSHCQLSFPG